MHSYSEAVRKLAAAWRNRSADTHRVIIFTTEPQRHHITSSSCSDISDGPIKTGKQETTWVQLENTSSHQHEDNRGVKSQKASFTFIVSSPQQTPPSTLLPPFLPSFLPPSLHLCRLGHTSCLHLCFFKGCCSTDRERSVNNTRHSSKRLKVDQLADAVTSVLTH